MSSEKCKLVNFTEEIYGNLFKTHLIDQYRLYIEMMDRISQRRMSANTFFITTNSLIITIYSILKSIKQDYSLLVSFVGIIICISWLFIIISYKQLNTGKFKVIHEIEKCLPLNLFAYEWDLLGKGKDDNKYWPLSHIECYIPIAFGIIYMFFFFSAI